MYKFHNLRNKIAFIRISKSTNACSASCLLTIAFESHFILNVCSQTGLGNMNIIFLIFFPTISLTRSLNMTASGKIKINAFNCKNITNMF